MNSTCELGRHAARALKPYQDYKDSGVQWLGKVPSHWAIRRIRTIAAVISGATPSSNTGSYWEGHIVWVTPQDLGALGSRYTTTSARRITKKGYEACGATMAPAGSVVISTRAPIGHTAILSSAACTNQGCRLLVPNGAIQPEHLYYSLKIARPELESLGQGTTFAELSRDELARFAVPVAPRCEQAAIVRFLDHADLRIRRYIRAKQKLIALLEEQKQAVIHRAVTRGLDPNVRLKPSGVEWLGDVPKHWKTERAKWLFRKMEQPVRDNDEVVTCFRDGVVTLRKNRRVRGFTESLKEIGYQGVRRGDLVIHAMDAFAGAIGVSDSDGKGTPVYSVCSPRQSANAYYYAFCVREMARSEWILALAKGIRERSTDFRFKDFASQWVPLPPLPEQAAIVSFLDRATADLDAATTSAQRETSLIREYHTHLIADVVTGKLDVREAAAGLPDEVKEPEPFDETSSLIDGEEEPSDDLDAVLEEAEV